MAAVLFKRSLRPVFGLLEQPKTESQTSVIRGELSPDDAQTSFAEVAGRAGPSYPLKSALLSPVKGF